MDRPVKKCIFHLADGKTAVAQGEAAKQIYEDITGGIIRSEGTITLDNSTIFLRHVTRIEYIR